MKEQDSFLNTIYEKGKYDIKTKEKFARYFDKLCNTNCNGCYRRKYISKKSNGTKRSLYIPEYNLKQLQRVILHEFLDSIPLSPNATAYKKGCSLRENASPHCGKRMLVKLDIRRFFDNISSTAVLTDLIKIGLSEQTAQKIVSLCCYKGILPQGAPTSPCLSNIVMSRFDREMGVFCADNGIAYTRYSDDMTFSFDEFDTSRLIRVVRSFLLKYAHGLKLNCEKTAVVTRNFQQRVTGIVVNEKPAVCSAERRKIRQEMYYISKYGLRDHVLRLSEKQTLNCQWVNCDGHADRFLSWTDNRYVRSGRVQRKKYLHNLQGRISFCLQVNPDDEAMKRCADSVSAMLAEYQR